MSESEIVLGTLMPPTAEDAARWNESRMRRRLLTGEWKQDVRGRLQEYFSRVRELSMGEPKLGLNLFESVINQQAVLYDNEPTVRAPEGRQRSRQPSSTTPWWMLTCPSSCGATRSTPWACVKG